MCHVMHSANINSIAVIGLQSLGTQPPYSRLKYLRDGIEH